MSSSVLRKSFLATLILLVSLQTGCTGIFRSSFFQISKENAEPGRAPATSETSPEKSSELSSEVSSVAAAEPHNAEPQNAKPRKVDELFIEPPADTSDAAGLERLMTLANIWSLTTNFHPWTVSRGLSLDSAFVRAAVRVRSATGAGEYVAALSEFLAVLEDPATRLILDGADGGFNAGGRLAGGSRTLLRMETDDSVLVLQLPADVIASSSDPGRLLTGITQGIEQFRQVVVDIRSGDALTPDEARRVMALVDKAGIASRLTTRSLTSPTERRKAVGAMYGDSHRPGESPLIQMGGWPFSWLEGKGEEVPALAPILTERVFRRDWLRRVTELPPVDVTRQIVIVANRRSIWPSSFLALLAARGAALFSEGPTGDHHSALSAEIRLDSAIVLRLRVGEVSDGIHDLLAADSSFAESGVADTTSESMKAALHTVRIGKSFRGTHPLPSTASGLPAMWDTASYPVMGARLLSVVRLWSALRTLHSHRDFYDEDLDEGLRASIRLAESAKMDVDYARAIAYLTALTDDPGVEVRGESYQRLIGMYALPYRFRWIDGRAIIADVADDAEGIAASLSRGDEIVLIDGFPVSVWFNEMRWAISSPNRWSRSADMMEIMRRGSNGDAHLRVRDAGGVERDVTVPRTLVYNDSSHFRKEPRPAVTRIGEDILVIDATATVEGASIPEPSEGRRGLIVDLRGDVTAAGEEFIRRVVPVSGAPIARRVRRGAAAPCGTMSLREAQSRCDDERRAELLPARVPRATFRGGGDPITLVLVDETTNSRGEWLALELMSSGVRLAGSATRGAFAASAELHLPGALSVMLPIEEIRTVDGGQLHRVGLTPHFELHQSVRALRGGTDAVMDGAVQQIRMELNPPPTRRRR